jgi:hypothetical protein
MKIQINNYVFSASEKTITFSDFTSINLENIDIVINANKDKVIYNPLNSELDGSVIGNILTIETDTNGMDDSDKLIIYYNDENRILPELESNGAMPVNIQDQTSETVDLFLCQFLNSVTLAENTVIDENTFTVEAGHNFVTGNMVCFKEGSNFMQARVLGVDTNLITINTPFDNIFTTEATVDRSSRMLNVNGSVTPQIFRVSPAGLNINFDITWMIFHITDNVAMDDAKFGGITALTNGIVLRKVNGGFKNIFVASYNGDFAHHCQRVEYVDNAPAGSYGLRIYKDFAGQENSGVTIRLVGADSDEIEVIVRDDLTGLSEFHVSVHGHVVTD